MSQINQLSLGAGQWPVLIIDEFHPSPKALVAQAGELSEFMSSANDFYPGVKKPLNDDAYVQRVVEYQNALNMAFGECAGIQLLESSFSIATKHPADLLPIQRIPHYDTTDHNQLALVHYLCQPKWGGTAFYRHRSTQLERLGVDTEPSFQQALGREATTHGLPPAEFIQGNTPLFEQIGCVQAKFNRAVIYPASLLHSGDIQTLHTDETQIAAMRLTITACLRIEPTQLNDKKPLTATHN